MILLLPAASRAQTLTWDPSSTGSASGSDNSGSWDTTTSEWFNGGTLADTAWSNGADAVIGAGTTLTTGGFAPAITIDEPVGVVVNSITFNAVGAGSTTGYTIADGSGTGANSLLAGGSNAMTINNNAVGVTTTINANILSNGVNPFALNVLGGGDLAVSASIGVSSGTNNAAGTLRVGSTGSSTGYTGTLTLSGINRLSAVTINSGTVSAIPASLGSGPVTLAGGTLSIGVDPATSIAMHVATSQTGSSTVAFVYNTMTPSMSAAGVVPVAAGNWNNLLISRGSTPQKTAPGNSANTSSNHQSALPFALNGANGAATTARVVDWWGSNTFSTSPANPNFASGTQQMFSSGLNANSAAVGDNQTSFTLSGIPYSSYNLYVYYGNNAAGAIGNAFLQTGSGTVTLPTRGAAPTGAQPGTYVAPTFQTVTTPSGGYPVYFYNTGGTTPPSTYTRSVATTQASATVSNYVEWTGVTGSDFFVALKELAGGTPWIAGLEIVPTSSTVSNPLSVTSSSTVNLAGSISLTGGATIASSGAPTVLSVTGSGNFLDLTSSTTTLSGTGGTLSPAAGVLAKLGAIGDGGSGFSTSGAGTVVLSVDNTSTLTGPVRIGGVTQLAMSSTTTGSATGAGSLTIAGGGSLTGNGIITPGTGNSVTVGSGGSIVGPASGSTLRVNGAAAINGGGLVQSGAGTLIFAGATTLNSGGSLAVGTGQLITANAGLALAGGTSTFTVTSAGTVSPFVNVLGGGASSLAVSGNNSISMLLSGNPNTQVGSTTTYDLFNYAGVDLAPSRSGGTLTFAGGTLAVSSPASGGLPPADQLTLVDIAGSGGNPNMIELLVTVPGPLTWTGATNGNWDSATTNWAASSPVAPTQYVDGSTVTFADKNPITNANVVNTNITITPAQVNPASIIFTNSAVNYSFSGGSIGGASGGVTLNGTGSVTLNNSNTFNGAVAVNAGQLILGQATALGNTPSVTVASGAALVLNNTSGSPRTFSTPAAGSGTVPLSLGGVGLAASPAGALESLAGNNAYNGAIALTAPTTINSASAALGDGLTLGGAISTTAGNFGLTFTGAGNTTASSGATGTNYVEGASVNFADLSLFGSTVSNVNGLATVNVQPNAVNPGSVAFTNTGAALGGVDYLINGGSIGGAATVLTKSGAGPVTINTSNTYGGGTVITGGTLVAAQPTSLGTGTVTLGGGALRLGSSLAGFGSTSAGVSGTSTWTVNSAGITSIPITSDVLTLTDNAGNESRSAFFNAPAPTVGGSSGFSARFVYTPSGNKAADGMAFILQNSSSGASAIGANPNGSALGYGGAAGVAIAPSVAFEMNIFASNTIGVAWRSNGATGAPYTVVTPVNLAGGDPIQVQLNYNQANTTLTAVLTDTVTNATSTYTNSTINAASVLGQGTAFVGFSGADGGSTSTQTISGFSYATTGAYANNVLLSPATTSTIDLVATSLASAYSMGSLTVGAGGAATLNVTAATAAAGQSYSLVLGGVTLNSSAIFNVANNGAAAGTLSLGAVGDGGAGKGITVGGPGTVVLTAGGSYGGPTTINGGVLRVNGAVTGTGAVAVNNGGTLSGPLAAGGAGSMAGAVTSNNGGSITASGVAAFSLSGGLTLATGSSSNFILNPSPNGAGSGIGLLATSSSSDRSLVINGSHTVNLAGTVPAAPGNYTYDLFSYTGPSLASSGASSGSTLAFTNAAGSLTLGSLPPGGLGSYQLVNNPNGSSGGQIDLAVTTYALAWTGANSSTWDTATQNWAVASPSPTPSVFTNGNPVVFGDTSPLTNQTVSNSTVTVQAGGVQPLSMTFTNSGTPNGVNYTIGGGPIGGSGGITLNGTGNVALAGANTFTGPVQLNAGTLIIGSDSLSSGSSSAAPLGAVSATAANDIFINGGTLRANVVPSATTAGTFTLNANRGIALGSTRGGGGTGTIDATSGTGLIYGGSIANAGSGSGALVKSSPGTLVLGGNSGYSGGTTVSGGTLAVGLSNNPAGSGPITLAGGNLQLYGQTSGSPAAGLAAAFYAGSSSLSTAGTSDPNLASLSALVTHFGSQTPAATALTTTGGMTSLNWPNVGAGNLFQSTQGYTGTVNYEAILAGTLTIAQGGSYTFQTGSDDGSVLYLDGSPTPLVNNNGNHGYQTVNSSAITLSPGVHSLVVGYYQGGGGAQLSISYNGPDTANNLSLIPDTALLTSSASGFPSAIQAYSNNVSLTSNATINVTGSLAASVGTLGLSGSTMSLTSGDLSASPYSLTAAGLNVSGTSGVSAAASSSGGAGVLQVTAPSTFASGAALNIATGKVRFNVTSGAATVGAGTTATVSSGATLELAGSVSALSAGANRVNVVNNSSAGGLVVSGTSQVVGNVDGNGTTQVNAGSDLTANHIVQGVLVIGGTAGSPALVTIDASDASGNSLAGSGSSLALAGSLKPSAPLAAGAAGSSGLLAASDVGAKGSSTASADTLAGSASVGGTAAVPEPSSLGLALLAAIGFGVVIVAQSRKAAR